VSILHDHTQTHRTRLDSSGGVISPAQRPLPGNTQHSKRQDFYSHDEIRTHNPSKRADAHTHLKRRGYWGRHENTFSHLEMNPRLRGEKPASTSNYLTLPRAHISSGLGRFNYSKLWLRKDDYVAFGEMYWVRVNFSMSFNGPTTRCNFFIKALHIYRVLFSGLLI